MGYHKKLFMRNPIVITVMVLYSLNYLVDRSISFYSVYPLFADFAIEIMFYYGLSFYLIPAFFNLKKCAVEHGHSSFGSADCLRREDESMSFSNYDSISNCDRYNPNRYDVSSPLYVSSLGKPI